MGHNGPDTHSVLVSYSSPDSISDSEWDTMAMVHILSQSHCGTLSLMGAVHSLSQSHCVSLTPGSFEGMGGMNVMDVRREIIPSLWNTVRGAFTKGFSFTTGDTKYPCICRRMKLPGRGVHSEVSGTGRL